MAKRNLPFIILVLIVLALVMIQSGHCAATVSGGAAITLPGGVTMPGGAVVTVPKGGVVPGGAVVTVPKGGVVPGGVVVTVPKGGVVPGGAVVPGGGATGTGTTSKSGHNAAIISRSSFTVLVGVVALAVLAS